MNINKFLKSLFGDKSSRDMRLIQPLVETVKKVYPDIQKLSNDELRAKTKEIQKYVQDAAQAQKDKIAQLKANIEETPIDEREPIFEEIDKLEKEALEISEKARLDGEYVKNISFLLDCRCFFGTIRSVLNDDSVVEGGTGELKRKEQEKETVEK